jgi:hypothetical protein
MTLKHALLFVLLIALWSSMVTDTSARPAGRTLPVSTPPVVQRKSLGAVHLQLETDRQTMSIADRLQLRLVVEAPIAMRVTFPQATDRLGPFTVLSQTPTGPVPMAPYTQRWQLDYTLEAEDTGELSIPLLTVTVQEAEAPQKATPRQLNTDPLTITVTTVLPEDADFTAPKDIAPPVVLTRRGVASWVITAAVGLAALVLLTGACWWYRRRSRLAAAPPPPQPAHVLALEALRRLQRQDLMTQQRLEEFYVRLSAILRRYVEWRFGLRAAEQTTEEFLAAVLATGGLIATHRNLLGNFLKHCDLVKFARHQPTPGDMQEALDSATIFVEQTADEHVMVEASVSGVEAL